MSSLERLFAGIRRLFTWWVIVAPWEHGLRVRLGKWVKDLKPGVHMSVPGIDRTYRQSVRLRTCDLGIQTVTTSDGETITIGAMVQYQIEDLRLLYETLHDPEATIIDMAQGALARFVVEHETGQFSAAAAEAATLSELDLAQYGLAAGKVCITDIARVRTYRLIQDPRMYRRGAMLDMDTHEGAGPPL